MLKPDALSQLRQLKSEIKASRNLVKGVVKGSAFKFGFVTLNSGKDIYLPPDEMQKVLPGDVVEVEIIKGAKNKNAAKIERLLESATKFFHGQYVIKGDTHFVDPDLPGMSRLIFIPPSKRGDAKRKDLVKCHLTQHPIHSGKAQASVVGVLGTEDTKGIEWAYAISKHEIATEWSEQLKKQLSGIDEALIDAKKKTREDLTHLSFVTIDARSTVDMDDALWVSSTEHGWELYVAIADPTALIEPNSAIEEECMQRATSVYLPGQHVPMLPEELAADLCSLLEGQDRLAKVLKIQVKGNGELGDYCVVDAFIRSRQKMSYAEVSKFLKSDKKLAGELSINESIIEVLQTLQSVSDALFSWRKKYALIHNDRKEFFLELDEHRKISAIKEKKSNVAHKLVEECMVAANRCVAHLLAESKTASIFIGHSGVRKDRLEVLKKVINDRVPACAGEDLSELSGFVQSVQVMSGIDEFTPIHRLIFKQLERSRHSLKAVPHFGMGLSQYLTFTSPLRKANDFLVHRQVSAIISGQAPLPIQSERLDALVLKWQHAQGATFDVEQWLKCQYIVQQKGIFAGTIIRVFSSGFQVRLDENGIEGSVLTREMAEKFSFNQDLLTLKGQKQGFVLDQKVNVYLKRVDWSRKHIQFTVSD